MMSLYLDISGGFSFVHNNIKILDSERNNNIPPPQVVLCSELFLISLDLPSQSYQRKEIRRYPTFHRGIGPLSHTLPIFPIFLDAKGLSSTTATLIGGSLAFTMLLRWFKPSTLAFSGETWAWHGVERQPEVVEALPDGLFMSLHILPPGCLRGRRRGGASLSSRSSDVFW